jgi:hypothetical protein
MERLTVAMRDAGFATAVPVEEDWGQACMLSGGGFGLLLGCSAYAEYDDGWLCFVKDARGGLKRLFQPKAAKVARQKAAAIMHAGIAADPRCRDLKWWTDDMGIGPLVDAQ